MLAALRMTDGPPRVAFLPFDNRRGSSLLRMYNIAEACSRAGWQCLVVAPDLSRVQRDRVLRLMRPDLLIVQGTRHPLNRRAMLQSQPYVLDLDDADFHNPRYAAALPELAAGAAGVIAGSRYIAAWAKDHNPNVEIVWTGAPRRDSDIVPMAQIDRPRILCWAQTAPLSYPHELAFVASVVEAILARGSGPLTFRFYDLHPERVASLPPVFRNPRIILQLFPLMEYRAFVASLGDVRVGLCPLRTEHSFSRGKSFGKVLAYLEARVPVICNDAADHALFFTATSGIVRDTVEEFAAETVMLLDDPSRRGRMADEAYDAFARRLSTERAAELVRNFAIRSVPALRRAGSVAA